MQVGQPQAETRSEQEAGQGRPVLRVGQQSQPGHRFHHFRHFQQTAQIGHLIGDAVGFQSEAYRLHILVFAKQHRHLRPGDALLVMQPGLFGDRLRLRPEIGMPAGVDASRARIRQGSQVLGRRTLFDLAADAVGQIQDEAVGTAVDGQVAGVGGGPVRAAKIFGEGLEVESGRSPPFENALVGVAHRGDRDAMAGIPEQEAEQAPLGRVGVLVFVQQNAPVALPDASGDVRMVFYQIHRPAQQVAVVQQVQPLFFLLVGEQNGGQLGPFGLRFVFRRRRVAGRAVQQVGGAHQVGGAFPRQVQQGFGDGGEVSDVQRLEIKVGGQHAAPQQFTGDGRRDDAGVAFHSRQSPVGFQQVVGEAVVGENLHSPFHLVRVGFPGGQDFPHSLGKFVGRLVGERDSQNLLRLYPVAVHHRRHAVGQGGGLAGARPGHHPQRLQLVIQDVGLFGGGDEAGVVFHGE